MTQIIVNLTIIIITITIAIITIVIIHIQQTITKHLLTTINLIQLIMTGGLGANTASTSDSNVKVTTQSAPRTQSTASTQAFSGKTNSYLYLGSMHIMYMIKLVVQSVTLGVMQITNAAAQSGYTVNNTPKAGAVMQTTQGGYGHVAYVENVNSDGSVTVSEMNYQGVGVVSTRTISASQASSYNYIS